MTTEQRIWDFFKMKGLSECGIAGMMGNIEAESGFRSNVLEIKGQRTLGVTSEQYTKNVDNGTYANFVDDTHGFGICQWTTPGRKGNLKQLADKRGTSIGDLETQMIRLWEELHESFPKTLKILLTATTVKEASDIFLTDFERPKDQTSTAKAKRAAMGQKHYDAFKKGEVLMYEQFKEMMGRYLQEQSVLPESPWAKTNNVTEKAKKLGITSKGDRPQSFATREEVEQMLIGYDERKKG